MHEAGWQVLGDGTGRFAFIPPGQRDPLPRSGRIGPASAEAVTNRIASDTDRDPTALQPDHWDGPGYVDYALAIAVLHQELSLPEPAMAT